MELKERCYIQIEKTIEEVLSLENIETYLNIVSNCFNMNYLNHLLIYRQFPMATDVAGIHAWEMRGRKVKDNSVPIALFYPKIKLITTGEPYTDEFQNPLCENDTGTVLYNIDPEYEADYTVVYAFDYSQTSGSVPNLSHYTADFAKRIRQLTDYVVMYVSTQDIQPNIEKGFYSVTEKEFQVTDGLSDKERDKTLLSLYIHHIFCEKLENDIDIDYAYSKVEEQLTKYCVLKYFGLSDKQPSFICINKIISAPTEVKRKILYTISHMTSKTIKDMVGYYLDFNETAILNNILESSSYKDLVALAEKIRPFAVDENIYLSLEYLISNLLRTKPYCLESLYLDRENKKLFSYPPKKLDMDEFYNT